MLWGNCRPWGRLKDTRGFLMKLADEMLYILALSLTSAELFRWTGNQWWLGEDVGASSGTVTPAEVDGARQVPENPGSGG